MGKTFWLGVIGLIFDSLGRVFAAQRVEPEKRVAVGCVITLSQPLDKMKRGASRLHEKPRYKYESLDINMNPIKMGVGAIIARPLVNLSNRMCRVTEHHSICEH